MVNRGRPSRDCYPCRKRKLRCDLLSQGCGQCQRAGLECHGYRDPGDLLFHDETRSIMRRVETRRQSHQSCQPATLQLGWTDRARYAFFSLYVNDFSHSLGAVAPLYRKARPSGHLASSVEATSLAFMAIHFNSVELVRLASHSYVTAIQRLSHGLTQVDDLDVDQVLQSILLLDTYEKMVNRDPRTASSWMSHIMGAMSLIQARGNQVISTPLGLALGNRLVTAMTVGAGATARRVPESLMALRAHLDPFIKTPKWAFTGILAHIVNLQADLCSTENQSTETLAARADYMNTMLSALQAELPASWTPEKLSLIEGHPLVFDSHYDIFPDHYATQVTNAVRAMRLLLYHIKSTLMPTDDNSQEAIREPSEGICASVPQFVLSEARPENSIPFTALQKLQCCAFLSPLYVCNQASTDLALKGWIINCLDHMSQKGGMRVAGQVAAVIRSNLNLNYWLVYAMTGSYAYAA